VLRYVELKLSNRNSSWMYTSIMETILSVCMRDKSGGWDLTEKKKSGLLLEIIICA